MTSPNPIPATDRFSLSIDGLLGVVAAAIVGGRMNAAMILLVWTRIKRIEMRVLALVASIRAGRYRGGWVVEGRAARAQAGPRAAPPASLELPRSFAWLIVLVPYKAAGFASQLRYLLADPEMVALLAAAPRLGRILRPLCRMLGIEAELLSPAVAEMPVVASQAVVSEPVQEITVAQATFGRSVSALEVAAAARMRASRSSDPDGGFFVPA